MESRRVAVSLAIPRTGNDLNQIGPIEEKMSHLWNLKKRNRAVAAVLATIRNGPRIHSLFSLRRKLKKNRSKFNAKNNKMSLSKMWIKAQVLQSLNSISICSLIFQVVTRRICYKLILQLTVNNLDKLDLSAGLETSQLKVLLTPIRALDKQAE